MVKKACWIFAGRQILEVHFHRWKRQFGHMEVNEARRLKELERENNELKKMLAESATKTGAGGRGGSAECRILPLARSQLSNIHYFAVKGGGWASTTSNACGVTKYIMFTARKGKWLGVGLPTTATHRNHVWTWDFIADATVRGGTLIDPG